MAYRVEGRDLVWDGFEKGIAPSPYVGVGDIRNANIISIPNEASVNFKTTANNFPASLGTCAVDAASDVVTYTGSETLFNGLYVTTTSTNGFTAATNYWIGDVTGSSPSQTFKVYTDILLSTVVNITSNGSNDFTTVQPTLPKHWAYDPSSTIAQYFFLDDSGRAWGYLTTPLKWVFLGNSIVPANDGNGLIVYHGWLIVYFDKSITWLPTDFFRSTWSLSSNRLNTPPASGHKTHFAIVGFDDAVYYCDGTFVGSIIAASDYTKGTVTSADAGSDMITLSLLYGAFPAANSTLVFYGASLPAGLSAGTRYFVATIGSTTASTIEVTVSTTLGGSIVNITGTGTGTYRNCEVPEIGSTWNTQALTLPSNEEAKSLAELGQDLLIGGITNRVYPWDRINTSFRIPILIAENNIQKMITVNTTTYIFAGNRGRIYRTNGSQAQLYKKIPDHLTGVIEPYITWQGLGYNRNQIYFSFSAANNAGSALSTVGGLWAIDINEDALRFVNKLSYDTYAGYASVFIPTQSTTTTNDGFGFQVGWANGLGGYGVDKTSNNPYSNYETYIDTDIVPIATLLNRKTFENIEFLLGAPLVSGEGIKIEYRTNLTEAFAAVGATNETTTAGIIADVYYPSFENVQWIQLRVYTKSTNTTPSYSRLREVRIR